MKAFELLSYLYSLGNGWLNLETTVDKIKAGNPEEEVRGIAVGWMSYTWALKEAIKLNCNVFITHEPTFYSHEENDNQVLPLNGDKAKKEFIEQNRLVVIRCHDLWDQIKDIGIPDSWAAQLDFLNPVAGQGYFRIFDVNGKKAIEIAHRVLDRTRSLGQQQVQIIGNGEKTVSRIAIGTGAITPFFTFVRDFQVDLAICTDDGIAYWRDGAFAIDMEIPIIVVNHATSELPGMKNLAKHLIARFPDIPVYYIEQQCMYRAIF